jgi:hypothetical protein
MSPHRRLGLETYLHTFAHVNDQNESRSEYSPDDWRGSRGKDVEITLDPT